MRPSAASPRIRRVLEAQWHGMPRQRVATFHGVRGRNRGGKLTADGECERAAVFTHHEV